MPFQYNQAMSESDRTGLDEVIDRATTELSSIENEADLEVWRIAHLGRSGTLTGVLRGISALPESERRAAGAASNAAKKQLESAFMKRQEAILHDSINRITSNEIDVTLPGRPLPVGRLHPSTMILREITTIFESMGFQVAEGPEVEWDLYNFEMLNIPKDHTARDQFDTFWLDTNHDSHGGFTTLLRTHTSPMQARIMQTQEPPIRVIVPGKCYRYEATDATHESQFHQVEGLAVDKGITFANLKHTLFEFAKKMFGEDRKIRFRCDYFPFVEPGVDMSIDWRGQWVEILGAGMVHPNVLRDAGYDPEVYTGFAFGLGPERIAMLKYGIDDVRYFLNNDLRFLRQF